MLSLLIISIIFCSLIFLKEYNEISPSKIKTVKTDIIIPFSGKIYSIITFVLKAMWTIYENIIPKGMLIIKVLILKIHFKFFF